MNQRVAYIYVGPNSSLNIITSAAELLCNGCTLFYNLVMTCTPSVPK